MVCTRPITGWRSPTGQVVFAKRYGWEDKPVTVPCGQCQGCRLEKSRQWALRIMHESSLYAQNSFLTLTYDDEHLPYGETLVPEHHQLFMKRLRKRVKSRKLRYYHCGEYGDANLRPHYHTILFNMSFADKRFYRTTESGAKVYTSQELDEIWGHGQCFVGNVTFESAAYCGRYVMKKLTGLRASEYGSREPEYSTMSRKPGLGAEWLRKWKTDVFPHDFCVFNGKRVRVPKAYDQWLLAAESPVGHWGTDENGFRLFFPSIESSPMEKVKRRRISAASKHTENQTRERLDVIEEVTAARVKHLKRS